MWDAVAAFGVAGLLVIVAWWWHPPATRSRSRAARLPQITPSENLAFQTRLSVMLGSKDWEPVVTHGELTMRVSTMPWDINGRGVVVYRVDCVLPVDPATLAQRMGDASMWSTFEPGLVDVRRIGGADDAVFDVRTRSHPLFSSRRLRVRSVCLPPTLKRRSAFVAGLLSVTRPAATGNGVAATAWVDGARIEAAANGGARVAYVSAVDWNLWIAPPLTVVVERLAARFNRYTANCAPLLTRPRERDGDPVCALLALHGEDDWTTVRWVEKVHVASSRRLDGVWSARASGFVRGSADQCAALLWNPDFRLEICDALRSCRRDRTIECVTGHECVTREQHRFPRGRGWTDTSSTRQHARRVVDDRVVIVSSPLGGDDAIGIGGWVLHSLNDHNFHLTCVVQCDVIVNGGLIPEDAVLSMASESVRRVKAFLR